MQEEKEEKPPRKKLPFVLPKKKEEEAPQQLTTEGDGETKENISSTTADGSTEAANVEHNTSEISDNRLDEKPSIVSCDK